MVHQLPANPVSLFRCCLFFKPFVATDEEIMPYIYIYILHLEQCAVKEE